MLPAMATSRRFLAAAALCALLTPFAHASDENAARAERWQALQKALFADRKVEDGTGIIQLDAPPRALDAALVPIGLQLTTKEPVKGLYLVIDNNPSPLAAHFTFGPKADPRNVKLRVRVNEYTLMHAIAETQNGRLYMTEKFVKAAGGCSAPAGSDDKEALRDVGRMKLRLLGEYQPGQPLQAQLMVRHPNFNGMQMNQITRYFTPPRFIRTTDVSYEGEKIFTLESDIAISTDPVFTFGFIPEREGQIKVAIRDSDDASFEQSFQVPAASPSS
jgi:sulfur-oxidizing protein SoxY